ncbi:glucosaminidase domain-containing protein [Candidatus Enterococcus ferrettii]|uniref:Mannosyl-glycoprotein endo-beta-N-acetylglucosamidase-like domain-containing protein n=1 Tax=Candidatus Enterococcus ferrettii TaxID=2815324 RepID=A0ABV0EVQ4_9ENTE
MWEQEVFRSRSKHPTLRKGIIGTTTLLGSASIAINSTSVLAHAAEEVVSTENKATIEAAPNSGSITFSSSESIKTEKDPTAVSQAEPTEKVEQSIEEPATSEQEDEKDLTPTNTTVSTQVSEINKKVESSDAEKAPVISETEELPTSIAGEEDEMPLPDPGQQERPTPNPGNEVETPTPDSGDEEEIPAPTPKPEEKPAPKPEQEVPVPEQTKPAEPEKEVPLPESEFEVIYVQQPEQQMIQEPIVEPIVVHSPENIVSVGPQKTTVSHGSIKFDRNLTTTEFIEEIGEAAREVGQEHDLYASVMIAQAILESGSGGSQLAQAPNYNLFGIKGSHEGKSVSFATQEDIGGGNMTTIQASFRAYDDYEDCFEDYAELLKEGISGNPDFYKGAWKTTTENYEEATAFLTGKYATDTSYNKKLNGLIETYNLTQYDHPKEEAEATNQVASSGYLLPLNDFVVSSSFGMRGSEFHRGIDLAAGEGMPIFASKSGTVLIAEYHYSWGNYIVIQHDNGETTLYAHQRNFAVNAGERVEQGQTIGFVGSTGNSTGSHLHFELCLDSTLAVERLVDPATVLF